MKKLFILFAFFGLASLNVNAQACNKSKAACTKAKATTTSVEATQVNEAAVKLASLDETVEKKVCATSGKVSFVRKNVCATSGTVSYTDVEYCTKSQKFVNVSPSAKASCSKASNVKSSCSGAKGAKATNVSAEKKSCCAGAAASCCAGKAKGAKKEAKAETGAKVKLISNED